MKIRCVYCSLRLDRLKRHPLTEENEQTMEKIRRWVFPRDVLCTDYVCHACWELINQNTEPSVVQGHQNVCAVCGKSVLRKRSRKVISPEMSDTESLIQQIIEEWIQPRELKPLNEVCIPCWLRAQRAAVKCQQQNQIELRTGPPNNGTAIDITPPIIPEQLVQEEYDQVETQQKNESNTVIKLPTIRRAASTAGHCLFPKCDEKERLNIPEMIRKRVLIDFNFYIPFNTRICQYHLDNNLYHELYTAENSMTVFTAAYVEDIVFLLRSVKQFDFSCLEDIDDHLFKYWFGRTKYEYSKIIEQVPRLNNYKKKLGFNALLLKMRTGDSCEKISSLFQVPRRTLEGYIDRARQILVQDSKFRF